jgi:hypothetical protein
MRRMNYSIMTSYVGWDHGDAYYDIKTCFNHFNDTYNLSWWLFI